MSYWYPAGAERSAALSFLPRAAIDCYFYFFAFFFLFASSFYYTPFLFIVVVFLLLQISFSPPLASVFSPPVSVCPPHHCV